MHSLLLHAQQSHLQQVTRLVHMKDTEPQVEYKHARYLGASRAIIQEVY